MRFEVNTLVRTHTCTSGQYYYVHETTKERRWTKPESETDTSDIKAKVCARAYGTDKQTNKQTNQ